MSIDEVFLWGDSINCQEACDPKFATVIFWVCTNDSADLLITCYNSFVGVNMTKIRICKY